jgi:hypothetical protein
MEKNQLYYEILDYATSLIKENNENHVETSRQELEKALDRIELKSRRLRLSKDEIKQYIDEFIRNSEIEELKLDEKRQQFIESLQQYNEKKEKSKQDIDQENKKDQPIKKNNGYLFYKDR